MRSCRAAIRRGRSAFDARSIGEEGGGGAGSFGQRWVLLSLESSSSGGGRGRARRRRRWRGETDTSRRRRIPESPFRRYFSRSRSRRSREPISGCGSGTHLLVAIPQGGVRGLRAVDPPRVFGDGPRGRGGGVVRLRAHDDRAGSAGAAIFSNTGKRALHLRHPGADGEGGRERRHRATSAGPRARRRREPTRDEARGRGSERAPRSRSRARRSRGVPGRQKRAKRP